MWRRGFIRSFVPRLLVRNPLGQPYEGPRLPVRRLQLGDPRLRYFLLSCFGLGGSERSQEPNPKRYLRNLSLEPKHLVEYLCRAITVARPGLNLRDLQVSD